MHRTILAIALAIAPVAQAQNVIGEPPVLEAGGTTCAQFLPMSTPDRLAALSAVEPLGGELPGADPAIAAQWADRVAEVCRGHPDRLIEDAARTALGGN